MLILGLTRTTLLDYPGHVAAAVFAGGCNFRCPFCHNRDIVLRNKSLVPLAPDEIFTFLKKRRNVLTGVCITGGEPTLYDDLPDFAGEIKKLGYSVKLDTNGSNPQMLQRLIRSGLIDYCAMDIKNAPAKYGLTAGFGQDAAGLDFAAVDASVQILIQQKLIPCEFRTTVVKELHSADDMAAIARWICGADAYFLQSYADSPGVLCAGYHAHSAGTLEEYAALCRQWVPGTALRGIY